MRCKMYIYVLFKIKDSVERKKDKIQVTQSKEVLLSTEQNELDSQELVTSYLSTCIAHYLEPTE